MKQKQKSLRQLAKEFLISASYLSQVKNGKRPASQKVLSNIKQGGAELLDLDILTSYNDATSAGVAELADAADLKSAGAILVGSSPTLGTN